MVTDLYTWTVAVSMDDKLFFYQFALCIRNNFSLVKLSEKCQEQPIESLWKEFYSLHDQLPDVKRFDNLILSILRCFFSVRKRFSILSNSFSWVIRSGSLSIFLMSLVALVVLINSDCSGVNTTNSTVCVFFSSLLCSVGNFYCKLLLTTGWPWVEH